MDRRTFLGAASAALLADALCPAASFAAPAPLKPMEVGLLVSPFGAPEATFRRVHDMGFSNCFLSLDSYLNGFTQEIANQFGELLARYSLVATTVEVVGPPPLEWNFLRGPSTIGLVPPRPAPPASTPCARPPTLPSCSAFPRSSRIAASSPKIPPIRSTREQSKPFALSPSTASPTGSTS